MLRVCRTPINFDCDEDHYNVLKAEKNKAIKNNNNLKENSLIPIGFTVRVQRVGTPWTADPWNHA